MIIVLSKVVLIKKNSFLYSLQYNNNGKKIQLKHSNDIILLIYVIELILFVFLLKKLKQTSNCKHLFVCL